MGAAMQKEYNGLEDWKKQNVKNYYETNFNYLDEEAANPVPYLEISWTTRFNAFLPEGNPWNYLVDGSTPLRTTTRPTMKARFFGLWLGSTLTPSMSWLTMRVVLSSTSQPF